MQQVMDRALDTRLCRAIERLRGIEMARVITDGGSEIMEVHVVATPERKPKQVVRDIESLLMAQFGLDIDYRKISLAQMEDSPALARTPRPRLEAAEFTDQEQRCVRIVLLDGNRRHIGIAQASARAGDALTLAALATLNAMHDLVGRARVFQLEEIQRTVLGGQELILVLLNVTHRGGQERLVGTCFTRDDLLEACARATLDCVNRRMAVLVA
jgi:hypothetical protein